MISRRTALGIGLAVASTAYAASYKAYAAAPGVRALPIDVLLVDKSLQMPPPITAYIDARRRVLPVVAIGLDAAGHSGLMDILKKSQAIAGISSGATLFCLERLAWNHGYRLTGRTQQCMSALYEQPCQHDVATFSTALHSPATPHSAGTCLYRPSQTDDTLHEWVMQKTAIGHLARSAGQ